MAGSIGIKQANGDFYSIMEDIEENSTVKKRLVLTTVHDGQKSVQIDLYKSLSKTMSDAVYIGSIVVDNISLKPKGEPSIEMTLSSTRDGSISAQAVDLSNPENKHEVSISLKSFEEDKNEYPDFEVGDSQRKKTAIIKYDRKFPWLIIIMIGLLLALLCLGLWFFLFQNKAGASGQAVAAQQTRTAVSKQVEEEAPLRAVQEEPPNTLEEQITEPIPPVQIEQAKPIVVETPPKANPQAPERKRPSAPVYSFNVPQTIPSEGIAYKIRWGDTLWDISEAFYRNPRLYSFIARSNGIRNSNLIVSGAELTILPRD